MQVTASAPSHHSETKLQARALLTRGGGGTSKSMTSMTHRFLRWKRHEFDELAGSAVST